MTIAEVARRGKEGLGRVPSHYMVVAIIALSSAASFGLGILEGREMGQGAGVSITEIPTTTPGFITQAPAAAALAGQPAASPASIPAGGEVVASKDGTKYYLPWCGTVKLIKEENKVWFQTRAAAEAAGYEPASNCKGL